MREYSSPPAKHVMCHVLNVTCHKSHVTMYYYYFFFFFRQSGEAYWWRVSYQRGLPRLVYFGVHQEHYILLLADITEEEKTE